MAISGTGAAWRPHVREAVKEIDRLFNPSSVGTYPGHDPSMSLAADFMCDKATGDKIAAYAKANARRLGIQYIIWWRRIWNIARDPEGWRHYFDGNSSNPSRAHTNHVHISWKTSPGTGGPAVDAPDTVPGGNPPTTGGNPIGLPGLDEARKIGEMYKAIMRLMSWATNKQNWINVLLVIVGALLILIALWRFAGSEVMNTVKVVAK